MLTLADVFEALTGNRPAMEPFIITEAAVDSRLVIPGSMFVALPGENVDGHDYIADAFQRGASVALVQRNTSAGSGTIPVMPGRQVAIPTKLEPPFCLQVENTLSALQTIASFWRRQLDLRVVAVTGSVGKSTTKEVIAEVLEQRFHTLKNPGNMNNEVGLPLTILKLGKGYERAVLEMGFYVSGEIALLCQIALPSVGVVTNIGTVHAERAGNQERIFQGKAELVQALPADGTAILNLDDPWVKKMASLTKAQVIFYGLTSEADLWADQIEGLGLDGIRFRMHYRQESMHVHVPMIGKHSVQTALRASAVGLVEGLTWQQILDGLRQGHAQLRLTAVRTENGALLLDDTYNASPESMLAALNLLDDMEGTKVAVLGDMLELGQYEKEGHEMVGVRAAEVADLLVTVGARAHMIASAARKAGFPGSRITEFNDLDGAIHHLQESLSPKCVVLVKGSHGIHMERMVSALEVAE
jgi:UDP-N-acetylmuramoyl-tripeptide--D-alanyl-D-alanine ligase